MCVVMCVFNACMYVCMHVCMCVRTHVRMHALTHTRAHARMHVYMYVCVCVCMYGCLLLLLLHSTHHTTQHSYTSSRTENGQHIMCSAGMIVQSWNGKSSRQIKVGWMHVPCFSHAVVNFALQVVFGCQHSLEFGITFVHWHRFPETRAWQIELHDSHWPYLRLRETTELEWHLHRWKSFRWHAFPLSFIWKECHSECFASLNQFQLWVEHPTSCICLCHEVHCVGLFSCHCNSCQAATWAHRYTSIAWDALLCTDKKTCPQICCTPAARGTHRSPLHETPAFRAGSAICCSSATCAIASATAARWLATVQGADRPGTRRTATGWRSCLSKRTGKRTWLRRSIVFGLLSIPRLRSLCTLCDDSWEGSRKTQPKHRCVMIRRLAPRSNGLNGALHFV